MIHITTNSPGEIWEDANGQRWLVIGMWDEPTVTMQAIHQQWDENGTPPARKHGGVSGLMWHGFRKVLDAPKFRLAQD